MNSMISTETFAQMVFWVLVGLTLGSAVIAVFPLNIIYNVFGMAVTLAGIGGLYFFLGSPFIAYMQILIYVGAICIAIVFAIMLSRPLHVDIPKRELGKMGMAMVASAMFFVGIVGMVVKTTWTPSAVRSVDWSVPTVGAMFLTRYGLVFEVVSLILLVAIIGAIVTAGYSRRLR